MITHIYAVTLAENCKSYKTTFAAFAYLLYFCKVQPLCRLSRKAISDVLSLASDIFYFQNFSSKKFGGFKEIRYVCSILQNIVTMTTILLKRQFLHAMVWKAETPQCLTIWHRTPKACLFTIPKKYSYDCKNQFRR